jgi:hypothetical protein
MTREKRQTLMFDDDFSKSDQYFAVLQTLHMCTDWITGTLRDLRELCQRLEPVFEHAPDNIRVDKEALAALCDAVVADSELHLQPLLDRIERKVEEVKGLRDGVCYSFCCRQIHNLTLISLAVQRDLRQRSLKGNASRRKQSSTEPIRPRLYRRHCVLPADGLRDGNYSLHHLVVLQSC